MPDPLDLEPGIRDQLQRVGTAPLASQLLKRGLRNVFIPGVAPVNPRHARMVGPAYTLRFIPMREDLANAASVANPANPQRAAIEQTPAGHVLVIATGGELGWLPRRHPGGAALAAWRRRGGIGRCSARFAGALRDRDADLLRGVCGAAKLRPDDGGGCRPADRMRRRGGVSGRHRGCG
jgi:regulator of RNase E activity RraA